jgi:trimeric autotransporter adhesin
MSIFERLSLRTYRNSCTFSLFNVTTGNFNTAVGAGSLDLNQADSNTATGTVALLFNTFGTQNTAIGAAAQ